MDNQNINPAMKDEILKYIKDHFKHSSGCLFPESECTCKDLDLINENTDLIKEGYLDSFSQVVLQTWIEKRFKVKINKLETVNRIADEISYHRR